MKKLFLTFLLFSFVGTALAEFDTSKRIQVDDLYYYLDDDKKTAEVTTVFSDSGNVYGDIVKANIPSFIMYNGTSYSVTSIGGSAFSGCSSLTSVNIPNSVTSIGHNAFYKCTGLTSVTIPNSVTSIGQSAFTGCSSLTSVNIPNSVTSIENYAFSYCNSLPVYDNLRYADSYLVNVADSSLSTYTIKEGTKWVGSRAFQDCKNLVSLTIPEGVIDIGMNAFRGCVNLKTLTIPNSIADLRNQIFRDDSSLVSPVYNNHLFVRLPMSHSGSYTIPDGIETVVLGAFDGCSGVTSLTVPNSVTTWYADGSALTGLTSPVYNDHTFIRLPVSYTGEYTIPNGIKTILTSAFYNCSNLTSVTIPNGVKEINNKTFANCTSLSSIEIPNSVTMIGNEWYTRYTDGVFYNCTSLKSIKIPNSVKYIGYFTFDCCNGLESVILPNGITKIEKYTFYHCGLTSIEIPNSVTSIGSQAFNCPKLTSVTCKAMTPPSMSEDCSYTEDRCKVFYYVDCSKIPLYVPANSVKAYKTADQWNAFKEILPISADSVETKDVKIEPAENTATVEWPAISGAYTYELVIKDKEGNIVCTLVFNEQGQLISIAFAAPSRDGAPQQKQEVGFSFIVTGLTEGTAYDLTITSKDSNGTTLDQKTVSFTTGGEAPQGIGDVQSDNVQCTKVIRNGQLYIIRGDKTYDAQGKMVK